MHTLLMPVQVIDGGKTVFAIAVGYIASMRLGVFELMFPNHAW